jgi:hypothetical protein
LVPSTVKLLHREKERKNHWGSGGLQVWSENRLLMRIDNSTRKGMSGMDKVSSEVHRVHMELGGKLLNSLTQQYPLLNVFLPKLRYRGYCHTQSLAATNRVTEQLSWLRVSICLVQ